MRWNGNRLRTTDVTNVPVCNERHTVLRFGSHKCKTYRLRNSALITLKTIITARGRRVYYKFWSERGPCVAAFFLFHELFFGRRQMRCIAYCTQNCNGSRDLCLCAVDEWKRKHQKPKRETGLTTLNTLSLGMIELYKYATFNLHTAFDFMRPPFFLECSPRRRRCRRFGFWHESGASNTN